MQERWPCVAGALAALALLLAGCPAATLAPPETPTPRPSATPAFWPTGMPKPTAGPTVVWQPPKTAQTARGWLAIGGLIPSALEALSATTAPPQMVAERAATAVSASRSGVMPT
jgi:hypothetical protein